MQPSLGRLSALLVAMLWGCLMYSDAGHVTPDLVKGWVALLFPLALIWFAGPLGDFTGSAGRGGNVDVPTPAPLIAGAGWFMLIGVPVILRLMA